MHKIAVLTLFPSMFDALNVGMPSRAKSLNKLAVECFNPRDYTEDKHQTVDDKSYGGGPGMVMMAEPLNKALQAAKKSHSHAKVIYLSPQGKTLTQPDVANFATQDEIILISGRYEGIDERFIESEVDEEWSIGDYVLSGGEVAALVLIDAMARLIPGVLGHEDSADLDSFSSGILDYPHYTRPHILDNGMAVPDVLLSGDHQAIAKWRRQQALVRTYQRRPELLAKHKVTNEDKALLKEWLVQHRGEKQ